MKKKYLKDGNYIKINLNNKSTSINKNNNSYGNSYLKIKDKYNTYFERNKNKNIRLLKDNSTFGKITNREYKENKDQNAQNLSLLPYASQQKNINSKKIEEFKKLQRNVISIRRKIYSMKVKDVSTKKKFKNNKYNIQKIITIQKWIKGYLLRSFLSNVCECETIMNDFIRHINKYIFLKINIFQKLKNKNKCNTNINDNILVEKKCSVNTTDNISSISIINTNHNTNTFTNNNTFSLCQDTPEILDNDNRKLIVNPRKNISSPSIRELLMANYDISKNNNNSKVKNNQKNQNNQNKANLNNLKNISRAKSLNDIKSINNKQEKFYDNMHNEEINNNINNLDKTNETNNNENKSNKENIRQEFKTPNLRSLLFNTNLNINNNNTNSCINKIYKKPINNLMYLTKESYYNINNIINYSPKSEKLNMPKIYSLSLEEDENSNLYNNNNHIENNKRKENNLFDNVIIEEIKEVKEDEEEDSQSLIDIKKNSTILDNEITLTLKGNESQSYSIVSDIQKEEEQNNSRNKNNLINNYNISSSSFQIKSCFYDKRKIFIIFLLKKQIMFCIKPYIFNLLKQCWIKKYSE